MDIINKGKLVNQNGKTYLTFDCGLYYYVSIFTSDIFPQELREKYLDLVSKALIGFTDETTKISGGFEHEFFNEDNKFIINVDFSNTFYKFSHKIVLPLTANQKDKVDYLEEKLEALKESFDRLTADYTLLKTRVTGSKVISGMQEIDEEDTSNTNDMTSVSDSENTDNDNDNEEEEKPQHKSKYSKGKKPVKETNKKTKRAKD